MRFTIKLAALASASLISLTTPALAQDAQEAESDDDGDIIVTGTLIRGSAPVGSNSITLGAAKIEEVGAVSTNELLATIPQVSNQFNRVPLSDLNIAVNQVQTSRPSIRSIGNATTATSPTLVLINGHRIAGVGTNQSSVDPDMIPVGAIARVDVMTEGGSATYGADAVAGVINFITLRRFDGVKVDADYGFADDYKQWSGRVTAGKDWGTGSAYVSYSYAWTGALYGRDRDYANNLDYSAQPYVGLNFTCSSPNLTLSTFITPFNANIGQVPYAAPNFVRNTANRCDNSKNATLVPKSERHGAYFGLNQEIGEKTTVDFRGFYGQRFTEARSEATGVVALGAGNPAAASLPSGLVVGPAGTITIPGFGTFPIDNRALVNFSFAPVLGPSSRTQTVLLKEWGADLEVTHDFSDDWQLKALAAWSESDSRFNLQEVNAARLTAAGLGTTSATAINPINIAQTNRALIDDLLDNELAGQVRDRLVQMRAIAEGRLFSLPGGDVRLAVGYEFMDESLKKRQQNAIRRGTLGTFAYTPYKRNVHSVFGELQVPIFGEGNASAGLHSMVLSLAGRFDHYSDFGNTFNPKIGLTYEPVEGVRLRGNWGTSFTAPNALDQLGGLNNVIGASNTHPFIPAGHNPSGLWYTVVIQGANTPLKPQDADTWSIGIDLEPTRELRLSASYYAVKFTNIISIPTPNANIFTDFSSTNFVSATGALTATQVRNFASQVAGGLDIVNPLIANGAQFYSLIDFRVGNYGVLDLTGLDFSATYKRETGFGSFDLGVNGIVQLTRKQQVSPIGAIRDALMQDASKLSLQATAGVDVGNFRAQATWNHSQGYDLEPTNSVPPQLKIDSFNTVNLFFKYDVPAASSLFKDLSFTLNINNVFDQDPPVLRRTRPGDRGFGNGFTLGRLFIIGASKKF